MLASALAAKVEAAKVAKAEEMAEAVRRIEAKQAKQHMAAV
jgi:hypothetical protein